MSNTNTGGPAFPFSGEPGVEPGCSGMTLRQYAAIHLKVPNSGTDWLDEMIEEANKIDREMLTSPIQNSTL
jgi:hypothetical protein